MLGHLFGASPGSQLEECKAVPARNIQGTPKGFKEGGQVRRPTRIGRLAPSSDKGRLSTSLASAYRESSSDPRPPVPSRCPSAFGPRQPPRRKVLQVELPRGLTSSRKRWRPRTTAIGASAGPSTIESAGGRRRAPARGRMSFGGWAVRGGDDQRGEATEGRQARGLAHGGFPPVERSGSPESSAFSTGWSGWKVCSSARPVSSPRPARPVTCCRSWNVRSAARGSPEARPRSASTMPTSDRNGKLWPLATSCVPMTI